MKSASRTYYESKLYEIFKIEKFYDHQWKVIKKILKGKRLIFIEKTGFGKSLCYQFPATQLAGVTLVFSPLISLMRDQVNKLQKLNISAQMIYSGQSSDEKDEILFQAIAGKIKLLYIAPERQETEKWLDSLAEMNVSLIVIDEAHCISEWGHDFRPSYQKIIHSIHATGQHIPILATTATATKKTIIDIKHQIGTAKLIAGSLNRENFHLSVVRIRNHDAKLAYIKEKVAQLDGNGIIYCSTRVDTECIARFLCSVGISAMSYHAGYSNEKRLQLEKEFMANSHKVVCSTTALGMGVDKPDVRFVIHVDFPPSPIHYYQEIGRGGRDGNRCDIILLFNPFYKKSIIKRIEQLYPSEKEFHLVMKSIQDEQVPIQQIVSKTPLSTRKVNLILHFLELKKYLKISYHQGEKQYQLTHYPEQLNFSHYQELTSHRLDELQQMVQYGLGNKCRMSFLRTYLQDKTNKRCGQCDRCLGIKHYYLPTLEQVNEVIHFLSHYFPEIFFEPNPNEKNPITRGITVSYQSRIGAEQVKLAKELNDKKIFNDLLNKSADAYQFTLSHRCFDYVMYVPPRDSSDFVPNMAQQLSDIIQLPLNDGVILKPPPQFPSSELSVPWEYSYISDTPLEGKRILLFTDIIISSTTLTAVARLLGANGAIEVTPLVLVNLGISSV